MPAISEVDSPPRSAGCDDFDIQAGQRGGQRRWIVAGHHRRHRQRRRQASTVRRTIGTPSTRAVILFSGPMRRDWPAARMIGTIRAARAIGRSAAAARGRGGSDFL